MRSLSVSFQSDTISIPISKKEKPVPNAPSDRTLRPSSNVAHKQVETPTLPRKPTPERKRSPLKGKNAPDQSENSRPVDGLNTRLIDQHRWPSRPAGNALTKSIDLSDRVVRAFSSPVPSLRRMPVSDAMGKPLQKSSSDAERQLSLDVSGRVGNVDNSIDDNPVQVLGTRKFVSTSRTPLIIAPSRSQSLPSPGSRLSSPSKTSALSSIASRGVSPSRMRPSTPPP